jgi:adenosine deaminase CECR1
MMKGLFNYETAYMQYTLACLDDFAKDNIQYAEIRPNFMTTNQVWTDDGKIKLNNEKIMNLIIDGYETFQRRHQYKIFKGLKVIYCTPRSFSKRLVAAALKECLEFKKKFPDFIAGERTKYLSLHRTKETNHCVIGFDLVGEEGNEKPNPLNFFAEEFLQFQIDCRAAGKDIPFLFHCGETQENGTATDQNLFDAVLLGAKRIGHGFAVPWHPWVMAQMKEKDICVELCPISNEILGLTPRIGGHSAYTLLANNVPCTISTDNGTLFRYVLI